MITIERFVFSPFAENTYIVYDNSKNCIIIDPGCSKALEEAELSNFIENHKLKPLFLLLTHGHIDHIVGLDFVTKTYNLKPYLNLRDIYFIENMENRALNFGIEAKPYKGEIYPLQESSNLIFDELPIKVLDAPGHSPGSVCLLFNNQFLVGGDVLFRESIGRTDLYLSNFEDLKESIQKKLYLLNDDIIVYPGHGIPTTIGHEKNHNPFIGIQ